MLKAENIASIRQYYFTNGLLWIIISVLIIRYFQLQILNFDQYSKKANTNRIRKVTLSSPRGLILDREGRILVDNIPTYILNAIPGELSNKDVKLQFVADIIGIDPSIILTNYEKYYRGRFISTRLAKDLTFEQISKLEENKLNIEGIYYQQFPERAFPSKVNASHILGYVKEVDRGIRNSLNKKNDYELGDVIGWSGLERKYESYLKGKHGVQFFEVDAFGREVGFVDDFPPRDPEPGNDIITTIDMNIQNSLEKAMINKRGVIIVGLPKTGEILGAVSMPDYKPDLFTGRITEQDWREILNHPDKPLVNRFNQGLYPPGSIVKMITEVALLENINFDPLTKIKCDGTFQFGDRIFGCWYTNGHGEMDLSSAIAFSCDIFFYKTIKYYDFDILSDFYKKFGFGRLTGVDIQGESRGVVPTIDYMNKRYGRFGWSKGSLLNYSIGQGELLVTPIQVFNYTNLLATKGKTYKPHFVKDYSPVPSDTIDIPNETWDKIILDMAKVISDEKGTGKAADPKKLNAKVFGKTGTAENPHGEDHAWFIGWMDFLNEKYSIVILLENAGSGGAIAAPIAKNIFNDIINITNI
tara:strand:+ start:1138 stop:2892 length:1755 start_codon:yes stop_codon:yes gene_type:complete